MADDCDDVRCGAVFPQGHLSGCRNAARPPKGRSSWDGDMADAEVEPTGNVTVAQISDEVYAGNDLYESLVRAQRDEAEEPFHAELLWAGTLPTDGVPGGFKGTFTALEDKKDGEALS